MAAPPTGTGDDDLIAAMLASELENDVDADSAYAYQLQMLELADLGSSSSSSSLLSISRPPPPGVSALALGPDEVSSLTAAMMAEEMERFELEQHDRDLCMAEFKQMREDLDRRLYDQKFAAEITSIPEEEWQKVGDDYHRPYDAASSSSAVSECFRVYSKGLVSEEYIQDRKVPIVGIGAAICDFKDNVLFEIKKPWIDGGSVSNVEAEMQAIVQGLDAALSLDLKRVTFFVTEACHYYVTGMETLGSSKLMALVNQAITLRTEFIQCDPSLLQDPNAVNFAYKLARDAVVAQISWPEETPFGKLRKETCSICFDDADVSKMFSVDGCLHRYCYSCMKRHVEAKLQDGVLSIKCPYDGCQSEISIDSCEKFLEPQLVSVMSQRIQEASIPAPERVYCPIRNCSALMSEKEVLEYSKASFIGAEKSGARKCIKCQHFFCINCRVAWHYNMSCVEYGNRHPTAEDTALKSLAKENRWRQCPKCNHMVELAYGCYHITCRCSYEFCYTCGAEWRNKKPTCKCRIWDERNIEYYHAHRRQR